MKEYVISFDVGGTRLKTGLISITGELIKSDVMPSGANNGPDKLYLKLVQHITETINEFGNPIGIALSLSGGIDPELGVVLLPGKFKMLEGFPIVPMLRKQFGLPVFAKLVQ